MTENLPATLPIPPHAQAELDAARRVLEDSSLASKLAGMAGTPIEALRKRLPKMAQGMVDGAVRRALAKSLQAATRSAPAWTLPGVSSSWMHRGMAATSGAVGGAFGLPGTLVELPISTTLLLRQILAEAQAAGEDPAALETGAEALKVFALGGPAAVQQWVWSQKIIGMRVDRTIAQLLRERGHLADSKDVATPVAMVQLLKALDSDTVLAPQSRSFLLGLMAKCRTGTRRIRALLPAGTMVEDKTGTLDGITNDVGFITMPDGRRVAIAVFARGGNDRQPVIAQLSRMIYDRFTASVRNAVALFLRLQ